LENIFVLGHHHLTNFLTRKNNINHITKIWVNKGNIYLSYTKISFIVITDFVCSVSKNISRLNDSKWFISDTEWTIRSLNIKDKYIMTHTATKYFIYFQSLFFPLFFIYIERNWIDYLLNILWYNISTALGWSRDFNFLEAGVDTS
jgi:hypothetical protein